MKHRGLGLAFVIMEDTSARVDTDMHRFAFKGIFR
jgi:hypothetical protein